MKGREVLEKKDLVAGIDAGIAGIMEPEISALSYLQSIYRDPLQPTGVRMRAAMAAVPFARPKLAVTAYLSNADDFAARLDKAILRSRPPKIIEYGPEHNDDEWPPPGKTILGSVAGGPRLVIDRVKSWEWESFPRREPKPARERL